MTLRNTPTGTEKKAVPDFKFRVLEYRASTKPGALVGRLVLEDQQGIRYVDCGYFQKADSAWIAPPARPLPLPDGAPAGTKPEYLQLIAFASPAIRKSWQSAAIEALKEHLDSLPAEPEHEEAPWP